MSTFTVPSNGTDLSDYLGGFVAGEATFLVSHSREHPSFTFRVQLGATDRQTCELFRDVLGVGTLHQYPRRKPHYDDEVAFQVRALRDLVEVVVPFMDEHLPPSHKREQYLEWRAELLRYWEHDAKRRRVCTVDGCDEPRRAHGLCRRHLYQRHGR